MLQRLRSALDGEWELHSVLDSLDTWAAQVHDAVLRDERKWDGEYRSYFSRRTDFTSHEQEIAYLEQWLVDRYAYVESSFWSTPPAEPSEPEPTEPTGPTTRDPGSPSDEDLAPSDDDAEAAGSPDLDAGAP